MTEAIDTTTVADDEVIQVRNLADHKVIAHTINDKRYEFPSHGVLKMRADEIRYLGAKRGGDTLVKDYLHIDSKPLALELGVSEDSWENEYSWDATDVKRVLTQADNDELLDALDLAPEAIKETIVTEAVNSELNDFQKREIIKEKTGQDITRKIENKRAIEGDKEETPKATRRRKASASSTTTKRRKTQE